eukprot:5693684-Pyramimonas_sp.AAC.1
MRSRCGDRVLNQFAFDPAELLWVPGPATTGPRPRSVATSAASRARPRWGTVAHGRGAGPRAE